MTIARNKIACFKVKLNVTRGLFLFLHPYGQGMNTLKEHLIVAKTLLWYLRKKRRGGGLKPWFENTF